MNRQIATVVLSISAVIITGHLGSCSWSNANDLKEGKRVLGKTIRQVLNEKTDEWMAIQGVEGTAIGVFEGKPCIKIFTSSKPQQLRAKIPSTVENYPVIIEETGVFRALDQE